MTRRSARGVRFSATAHDQLSDGSTRLARGPSRYGRLGMVARAGSIRATRHRETRQRLLDERIVLAPEELAFETGIAHAGTSRFPDRMDPGEARLIDTEIGPLYVHADDEVMTPYIAEHRVWEPAEMAFIRSCLRPGHTLLDVGANVGWFSVFGAQHVGGEGRVIAVEPESRNLTLLKANLWQHGCANVSVLPLAAGSVRGFVGLQRNESNRGDHQVGLDETVQELVSMARLDELLDGVPLDFVKLDTQGFDHEAIAGLAGSIDVLGEDGQLKRTDPEVLVHTARTHPVGYLNVVLRGRV